MTIIVSNDRISGDLEGDIARLESLTADLERLACGDLPTQQQLAGAPFLDNYLFGSMPVACLVGENYGHPLLKGRFIHTSELWVKAPPPKVQRALRINRSGTPFM